MNRKIGFLLAFIISLSSVTLFKKINLISMNIDMLHYFTRYAFIRKSILEYQQFPLRNPYLGGGFPSIGDPEDLLISPLTIPPLIFGEVIGVKINIFIFFLIAGFGMYYFARVVMKYNYFGSIFSTLALTLSGWISSRMLDGNYYEVYFLFYPLLIAFLERAEENKKFIFYSALLLSLVVCGGGKLVFIVLLLFLVLYALINSFHVEERRPIFNPQKIKNLSIIIFLTAILSMVKILPMVELLLVESRTIKDYLMTVPFGLYWQDLSLLVNRDVNLSHRFSSFLYVGYIPVFLFFFSCIFYGKKLIRWLFILVIAVFLTMGSNAPIDLFNLLWHLPLFRSILVPSKYFNFFILFVICLSGGKFFSFLERYKKRGIRILLSMLLIIFAITPLFLHNFKMCGMIFNEEMPPLETNNKEFFQVKGYDIPRVRETQYFDLLQNIGTIDWYGGIIIGEYAVPKYLVSWDSRFFLNPVYKGEFWLLKDVNSISSFYFSPNRITGEVVINEPDTLVLNQNYHPSWQTNKGLIEDYNGLLSVRLEEKGSYSVKLNYVPKTFYIGLVISLFGFAYLLYYFFKPKSGKMIKTIKDGDKVI